MRYIYTTLFLFIAAILSAQNFAFDYSDNGKRVCLVEARVDLATPSVTIILLDSASNTATTTSIYRRHLYGTGADWVSVASALPVGTGHWTDTNVQQGEVWEYQIKRTGTWQYNSVTYDATGYTIGSLLTDKSNYQGQMILLVADNIVNGLSTKYTRLKKELTGEGWLVNEIVVPKANGWDSGDTVVGIRNQVKAVYNNAPTNDKPKMLLIVGHVPMPRSGSSTVTAPDEHDQNKGARGCDGYYADVDGVYTDTATYNPGGQQTPLAINLPGDYKWDQDFFPSQLEMAFGRVDFQDIINTNLTELQLTEQYLDRLSNYRNVAAGFDMGRNTAFHFGYDNSNDGSYRTLPNISQAAHVLQDTSSIPFPQWVHDNGPFKVFQQNVVFPEIGDWQTYGMDATVYTSDQSYWGFNDVPQDFYYSRIRALLAVDTKCLVTLWTTTGVDMFYQACSGDALGQAVKEIMNYNTTNNNIEKPQQQYDTQDWWNRTHFAYNGDPTLRLYQVPPPTQLALNDINHNAVISWNASSDSTVMGYQVYKSETEFGKFERVTTMPINAISLVDSNYQQNNWYMVRAVKTMESGCGKFLCPSLGIFLKAELPISTGVNAIEEQLRIFPNPTSHLLNVAASYNIQNVEMESVDGRKLITLSNLNLQHVSLDISAFASGIYLLKIVHGDKIETKKVVVE